MAIPSNQLQNVRRYVNASLALLLNQYVFLNLANKKFLNFEKTVGNLGDTIDFVLPTRYVANDSLVANFQGSEQRVETLKVTNARNVAIAFTAQQFIFNVDEYMQQFGKSAIAELGTQVEEKIAGLAETVPYRFVGDGVADIGSFEALAQAMADFRDYGSALHDYRGILPMTKIPKIIGTGLNEFATNRNNEIAQSWELGPFTGANWYQSNLLPVHESGTVGNQDETLTVVSINPAGDEITVNSSGGDDADAIRANDSLQFQDGVSGQPNIRYLTWVGHKITGQPVQVRATADAAATGGGNIVIPITPALISSPITDPNRNLSLPVAVGMELKVLPSHRCGLIYSGDALFVGMPKLPDEDPFFTQSTTDPASGASLRMYTGSKFGQNERGTVWDVIWAETGVPEYMMKMAFPL